MFSKNYSIQRVPLGLTAVDIAQALRTHFNNNCMIDVDVIVKLLPKAGAQHAALVHFKGLSGLEYPKEIRVVYDLEAQEHFTLQLQSTASENDTSVNDTRVKQWRWALRGIVIQ